MLRYIAKRLLTMIPVLIGISFIIFVLMYFTPGDPAEMLLGDLATPEQVDALREELGLNDGFFQRYFNYMKGLLKGDLGKSYVSKMPVWDEIATRLPVTARVAFLVAIFAVLIGIPIGILSAVRQYSFIDSITRVFALLGITMPSFWLALLLVLLFSVQLGWLPPSGLYGPIYYIMPILSISAVSIATITRTARSSMLEVIRQDYVRTARAKGQYERVVLFRHALLNAMIPILTIIGIQFAGGLGGAVVNEQVFAIPGLGKLMVDAIKARNYPLIQGSVLVLAVLQSVVNLVVDILYAFVDPRIRSQYSRKVGKKAPKLAVAAAAASDEAAATTLEGGDI
ncbi:MAG TPA: ABC transporter permease [Clostridiaceae bacterium]|nr:ABC transporter permease [Clostridiaceae bacterium]